MLSMKMSVILGLGLVGLVHSDQSLRHDIHFGDRTSVGKLSGHDVAGMESVKTGLLSNLRNKKNGKFHFTHGYKVGANGKAGARATMAKLTGAPTPAAVKRTTCKNGPNTVKFGWKGAQFGANYCRMARCTAKGLVKMNLNRVCAQLTKKRICTHTTCHFGVNVFRADHARATAPKRANTPEGVLMVNHHHSEYNQMHQCKFNRHTRKCACKCGGAVNKIWEPVCNGKGKCATKAVCPQGVDCTDKTPLAQVPTQCKSSTQHEVFNKKTRTWACMNCPKGTHAYKNSCYKSSTCLCPYKNAKACLMFSKPAYCSKN